MSIDIENNFAPTYKIIAGKEKTVRELKALKKDCKKVMASASDEDREGEAIAESIKDLLGLKNPDESYFMRLLKMQFMKLLKILRQLIMIW